MLLAIDPGTEKSGFVWFDGEQVYNCGIVANFDIISDEILAREPGDELVIEMVASYGMAVGKTVFETVAWIGRFEEAWRQLSPMNGYPRRIYRQDVKLHLCNSARAKDSNIRQALIDKFPATGGGSVPQVGTKAKPGPLYGVKSHIWSALAVAVTAVETEPVTLEDFE